MRKTGVDTKNNHSYLSYMFLVRASLSISDSKAKRPSFPRTDFSEADL